MKYKVGDEVLVKCKIIDVHPGSTVPYEVARTRCNSGFAKPLYVIAGDEDIEDITAEEAWEIAMKISLSTSSGGLEYSDLNNIFDTTDPAEIMKNNTPQEAKDKIEAWEAEKEIRFGDVITPNEGSYRAGEYGLVVCIKSNNRIGVNFPEDDYTVYEKCNVKNTGRHIDIDAVLKQIGGDK